ncbi:MAG: hypothetical protein ACOCXH_02540 [Cyclobacteriaceae bacterium]
MKTFTLLWKNNMKIPATIFLSFFIVFTANAQFDPDFDEKDTTNTEQPQEPQNEEDDRIEIYKPGFLERTYAGGNLGLSLGTGFFFIDIAPLAGYDLIPQVWSVGLGATYRYQRVFGNGSNIYGGRAFTRINIGKFGFLHGEYEYLSHVLTNDERIWDGNILAGGGVWFNKSDRGGFYLSVLYALTADSQSFYSDNPLVISPGFVFYIR